MARILVIEDSPTEAAVLTQLLERNGHQVTTSGSAEDGIASCKRDLPDIGKINQLKAFRACRPNKSEC